MKKRIATLFVFAPAGCLGALVHSADPKSEHAQMKKEHASLHQEHDVLLSKIGKEKVEHRRALATLAEIQARILRHGNARRAGRAREHEDHIHHHDDEIAAHDKSSNAADHAELARAHAELMKEHTDLLKAAHDHKSPNHLLNPRRID